MQRVFKSNTGSTCEGRHRGSRRMLHALLMASAGISAPALAQETSPAPQADASGGDIVVTANRRSESAQRVPIAVTALNPDELAAKGLGSLSDIASAAPAINFQQVSTGVNRIDIRGITTGTINVNETQDHPLVAIYLDDVPLALQSGNPELKVFDLERIEVIRGPQGTLYGAGSMAGTIRYITAKPSTEGVSGSIEAGATITQSGAPGYNVRGLVNVPLTGDLAVRIGGYQGREGGWIDNLGTGDKDANDALSTQARVAARWTPSDRLTIDGSFTYARLDTGGHNSVFQELPGRYKYTSDTPEGFKDRLAIYNLTGTYDIGGADLISSSSYVSRKTAYRKDYGYAGVFFGLPSLLDTSSVTTNDLSDFSQEVRLVSSGSDVFNWTVGLFYEDVSKLNLQSIPSPGFDDAFGAIIGDPTFSSKDVYLTTENDDLFQGYQKVDERQFAAFGEAKLTLGKFDLTAGLRYFDFKQDFYVINTGIGGAISPGVPTERLGQAKADGFNPRAVVAFRPTEDVMIYAEAARGFRYGGVNGPVPPTICVGAEGAASFGPDKLWSYTIGEKAQFLDRRATVNISAFYVKWTDVQTTRLLNCGYTATENNGTVTSKGVELESRFRLTDAFTVALNASYTDATADGPIANVGAADGDRVPFFPRYTVAVSGDYRVPVGNGELALSADFQARGKSATQFDPGNPLNRPLPATQIVNASIRYEVEDWEFGVFGTNLNNSRNISLITPGQAYHPGDQVYYGRPRTFGVRAKRKF